MDDLKSRGSFHLDNLTANYLLSPLFMSQGLDPQNFNKQKIEKFESPAFAAAFDLLKSNVSFQEPRGGITLPKDDDFQLDQGNNTKLEANQQIQQSVNQPQLDISFDNQGQNKLDNNNQFLNFDQLTRSRGPSFSFGGRGRLDSEDLFGNPDLLNHLSKMDLDKNQPALKTDLAENLLENNFGFINQSPHFLPMQTNNKQNPYELLFNPMLMQQNLQQPQISQQLGNFEVPQSVPVNNNNQEAEEGEKGSKPRKKKKTDQSGNPSSPKKKNKNKDEISVQTNGNQFSMKITKENGIGAKNSKKEKNKADVKMELAEAGHDDKSTDISSGLSTAMKMEDLKSRGIPNHLLQNMQFNPQMQGYLQNQQKNMNNQMPQQPLGQQQQPGMQQNLQPQQQQPQIPPKKIGCLTVEERRIKVQKYLEKRKKRNWTKKISYDCRRRVADSRLRIKGRFVTKDQAYEMLGSDLDGLDIEKLSTAELKEMLLKKFGGGPVKKDGDDKTDDGASAMNDGASQIGDNKPANNNTNNNTNAANTNNNTANMGAQMQQMNNMPNMPMDGMNMMNMNMNMGMPNDQQQNFMMNQTQQGFPDMNQMPKQ